MPLSQACSAAPVSNTGVVLNSIVPDRSTSRDGAQGRLSSRLRLVTDPISVPRLVSRSRLGDSSQCNCTELAFGGGKGLGRQRCETAGALDGLRYEGGGRDAFIEHAER